MDYTDKRFQWIKSDKAGNIELYKDTITDNNINWISFQSGNRVNEALINDVIIILEENEDPLEISIDTVKNKNISKENKLTKSPLESLIDIQIENNYINIPLSIELPLLKKDVYTLLKTSFKDEDIDKILLKCVSKKINIDDLQKNLAINITKFYLSSSDIDRNNYIEISDDKIFEV